MGLGKESLFIINTDQLDLQFILQKRKKPLETFQKATYWKSCSPVTSLSPQDQDELNYPAAW